MSHGPLMPCPENVSRTRPWLLSTIRQPALAVADIPLDVGRLPTITQPCTTASAVVRPTPPGQAPGRRDALICANLVRWPRGLISTIVVPVPCRFALLLKLLISTWPRRSLPRVCRMATMPYGLTSPFRGTVEPIVLSR